MRGLRGLFGLAAIPLVLALLTADGGSRQTTSAGDSGVATASQTSTLRLPEEVPRTPTVTTTTVDPLAIAKRVKLSPSQREWLSKGYTVHARVGAVPPLHEWNNGPRGIAVEYLNLICRGFGIRCVFFTGMPWSEAVERIGRGDGGDVILTILRTADRLDEIAFTKDYLFMPWVIFSREGGPIVTQLDDLDGKTVSVEEGFAMKAKLASSFPNIRLKAVKTTQLALRALATAQVDAYVGNLMTGLYLAKREGLTNIKVAAPTPFGNHNQAMGVRKDWPELATLIDAFIEAMTPQERAAMTSQWLNVAFEGIMARDTVNRILMWLGVGFLAILTVASSWVFMLRRTVRSQTMEIRSAYQKIEKEVADRTSELRIEIVERKQAEAEANHRVEETNGLLVAARAVLECQDFESAAKRIFDACREVTGAASGYVALLGEDGREDDILFSETDGLPSDADPTLPSAVRDLRAKAYATGKVVYANDFVDDGWSRGPRDGRVSLRNLMFSPVTVERKVVGIIGLANKPEDFSPDDARIAGVFGELAVAALRRIRAENALRESEAQFRAVIDNSPAVIVMKDRDRRHVLVNAEFTRRYGLTQEQATEMTTSDFMPENIAEPIRSIENQILATGETISVETELPSTNGKTDWRLATRFPIHDAEGAIVGIGLISNDINQLKQAEEDLKKSQARFAMMFMDSPVPQAITAIEDGRFFDVNRQWESLMGYSREEVVGKTSGELGLWTDLSQRQRLIDRFRKDGRIRDFQTKMVTKSGCVLDIVFDGQRIESGGIEQMLFACRDLTEHNRLEEQLRHAQKMEVIGQMTGGVAHDFNNLLQVVETNLDLALSEPSNSSKVEGLLKGALRSGRRGALLTQQLLAFSRKQTLNPQNVSPRSLVAGIIPLLSRTLGEDISIRTEFVDDVTNVIVDENGLTNAILNLAINARAAMPKGGTLTVAVRDRRLDAAVEIDNGTLPAGVYIEFAVADTGYGMSEETLERAFEPFFTTKEVGEGSGLGLSMVYGFARQSGGNVTIESHPGTGTTVRILLPATTAGEASMVGVEATATKRHHAIKVLLVEDDADVRESTVSLLKALGCEVIEADNAGPVPDLLETNDDIDLFICDVVLPGPMNGIELVQETARLRPSLKVILVSGYPRGTLEKAGLAETGVHLLSKPFSANALSEAIELAMKG